MSFIKNFKRSVAKAIEHQRKKPKRTRQKILLGCVVFTAVLLISFWIWQLKENIFRIELESFPKPEINLEDLQNSGELIEELKNISNESLEEIENLNKNLEEPQEKFQAPSTKFQTNPNDQNSKQ